MIYDFDDSDEKKGRIRSDEELARFLKDRNDFFYMEKSKRVSITITISLLIGITGFIWLSSLPRNTVVPDFYQKIMLERMVKLSKAQIKAASVNLNKVPETVSAGVRYKKPNIPKPPLIHNPASKQALHLAPVVLVDNTEKSKADSSVLQQNEPTEDENTLLSRATVLKKQQDYGKAIDLFGQVLKKDPKNADVLANMGELYRHVTNFDSSIIYYNAALAVNPRLATAHDGLASSHYYLSTFAANPHAPMRDKMADPEKYIKAEYDSAIAGYTRAIEADSTFTGALTNRGVIRDIRNDHYGAIRDYTRAIQVNPLCATAYSKRGDTYKNLGKFRDALKDYTAAIKLDSSYYEYDPALHFANAYFGRGCVYYKMNDYDRAIADFDSTLALSPKHSLALLDKAIALDDKKLYDSAIVVYTTAIAMFSPLEYDGAQALGYIHRGNAYRAIGKYDKAIDDYTKALDYPTQTSKACWRIAECYALKHDDETAIVWLKKSVANGFADSKEWKKDASLTSLHGNKEFEDIIKQSR